MIKIRLRSPGGEFFSLFCEKRRKHQSTLGPAATSALPASLVVYLAKFFTKRAARSLPPMVDDILELVLDLLFDGTTALADAQKVPLAVRALLYVLLTAALMGIAAYLAWQGVQENSILLLLLASGMLIGSLVLLAVNLKKLRRPRP